MRKFYKIDPRLSIENLEDVLHEPKIIRVNEFDEEIKSDAKHLDEMNKSLYKRISVHIGHEPGFLGKLIKDNNHVDWFLTAKQAKRYNIANHLRIPSFEVEVNLNISFK